VKQVKIEKKFCAKCGKTYPEHSLEIHHIDGNHINNDLNNLEIWCTICHRETHFGRKEKKLIIIPNNEVKLSETSSDSEPIRINQETFSHLSPKHQLKALILCELKQCIIEEPPCN
jgi:5-methylcytosine-specific restriction endonuclease McrA